MIDGSTTPIPSHLPVFLFNPPICDLAYPSEMRVVVACMVAVVACSSDAPAITGPVDSGIKDSSKVPDTSPPPDPCTISACDDKTGLCKPEPSCDKAPCPTGTFDAGPPITTAIDIPTCKTTDPNRKSFDDGAPRTWKDSVTGESRAACVYVPPAASAMSLRPLVVFLHAELGHASAIYDATSLRAKAETFDLVGDGKRPGFILASDQGRNLQLPNTPSGAAHDYYYRQPDNPDVRNLDKLIDDLVAEGKVDTHRIYVMGSGNGGFFAESYVLARHDTPTAGGAYLSGAAVYSAADPYQGIAKDETPTCSLKNGVQPQQTPLLIVGRSCDLIACDISQVLTMRQPPGAEVDTWFKHVKSGLGDSVAKRTILDDTGKEVFACATVCDPAPGLLNHQRWPDGVDDKGGIDTEQQMLTYLQGFSQ